MVDSHCVLTRQETRGLPPLCSALSGNPLPACGLPILHPEGLNIADALSRCGLADKWKKQKAEDKLACIVHLVLEGAHRDIRNRPPGFYVPFHSRWLQDLLGSRFAAKAIRALSEAGIIEANPRYSAGRFTKSYRLTRPYRAAKVVSRAITDATLIRNLTTDDAQRSHAAIRRKSERSLVWDSLCRATVSPQGEALAAHFAFSSPQQQAGWLLTLRGFAHGLYWLRADENTGRIFHNVTQCPRELRPLLLLDGEAVVEVDIANAQPFLALSLYPKDHPERRAYASFVTSVDFYAALFRSMPRKARRPWGTDPEAWTAGTSHRDRFKVHALRHILYDVTPAKPRALFETFAGLFPWLAGELALKRATKAGAGALACELQRSEANLVLGRIVPRIRAEVCGCRAVTIHDGLLCSHGHADAVRRIVEEESEALLGVRCVARIKRTFQRAA